MQYQITHHIQKYIISVLLTTEYARFRDLRPPNIDTNLYSYHLKIMQKDGWIIKTSSGYTLSQAGLAYVDRVSSEGFNIRSQPKMITMLVVQNSDGDVLLLRRTKQPYINTWSLPYGKTHIDDATILEGAKREWDEKIGTSTPAMHHAGDCYIRVGGDDGILSSTLVHVFFVETDDVAIRDRLMWARPHKLADFDLAPAVLEIMTRTFFRDPYFFEEYEVNIE